MGRIRDKLVDSVIEYHMDREIFHRHLDEKDEECDWGEWWQVNYTRHSYDVLGRRRSPRDLPSDRKSVV